MAGYQQSIRTAVTLALASFCFSSVAVDNSFFSKDSFFQQDSKQELFDDSQSFDTYKDKINADYDRYVKELEEGFAAFAQIAQEEESSFQKQVTTSWGSYKGSDKKIWVNYDRTGTARQSVNFETGEVTVEIRTPVAMPADAIKRQAEQQVQDLLTMSEREAFLNDSVAQKVEQRLMAKHAKVVQQGNPSDKPVLATIVPIEATTTSNAKDLSKALVEKAKVTSHKAAKNSEIITEVKFTIPTNVTGKAKQYLNRVKEIAAKEEIPIPLMLAIMENESSFNPRAKSHVPAYGLMQIVPVSAGKDATAYLFGKAKVLSPSYLYESEKNIEIGGAYLHILYYRYLKAIDDPTSRLFCTIAAYNTGAGNVAKTFIGERNPTKAAKKINQMSSQQVYKTLRANLPYDETKRYMKKVSTSMAKYQ